MSNDGHSQLPWIVLPNDMGRINSIVNPDGEAEFGTWLIADCRWPVDAAFIVKACNAHDDLVAALRGMILANEGDMAPEEPELIFARAALAKAEAP